MPARWLATTVTAQAQVPLVNAGDGETLISNNDPNNTLYLSDDFGAQASFTNTVPIGPGGWVAVNGEANVYGVATQGQTVQVVVIPGGTSFFQLINIIARTIEIVGPSGEFLFYNGPIARGNLSAAFSPSGPGIDSVGNQFPVGYNFGIWDPVTGLLKQHYGINDAGDIFLVDQNGNVRMHGFALTGQLRFFNAFGAVLMIVDPADTLLAFYQDKGSATQGGILGGMNFSLSNVTEPITSAVLKPGFSAIDPVFGDYSVITGGFVTVAQALFNKAGQMFAQGGTDTSHAAYTQLDSPLRTAGKPYGIIQIFGGSDDGTSQFPGTVFGDSRTGDPLIRLSPQEVEIQGAEFLTDVTAPATPTGGTAVFSGTGQLRYVGEDANNYATGCKMIVLQGQTISTTTFTQLTGASVPVIAGTYIVRIWMIYKGALLSGNPTLQVTGPTTSSAVSGFRFTQNGAGGIGNAGGASLNANIAGPGFQTSLQQFEFWGTYTFSASGNVTIQGETSAVADSLIISGGYMELLPV